MTKRGKSEMKFETANANEIKFSNAKRAGRSGMEKVRKQIPESLNLYECKCKCKRERHKEKRQNGPRERIIRIK